MPAVTTNKLTIANTTSKILELETCRFIHSAPEKLKFDSFCGVGLAVNSVRGGNNLGARNPNCCVLRVASMSFWETCSGEQISDCRTDLLPLRSPKPNTDCVTPCSFAPAELEAHNITCLYRTLQFTLHTTNNNS